MKLSRSRSPLSSKHTSISTPLCWLAEKQLLRMAAAAAFWSTLPAFSMAALSTYMPV